MGRPREVQRQKFNGSAGTGQIWRHRGPQLPLQLTRELGIAAQPSSGEFDGHTARKNARRPESESGRGSKSSSVSSTAQVNENRRPNVDEFGLDIRTSARLYVNFV
jgi:hypothetical protein